MTANAEDRSAEFPSAADAAGALDLLLSAAALGTTRMLRPDAATLRLAPRVARGPQTFARRMSGLTAELAKIAIGDSQVAPGKRDRRFRDPEWGSDAVLT